MAQIDYVTIFWTNILDKCGFVTRITCTLICILPDFVFLVFYTIFIPNYFLCGNRGREAVNDKDSFSPEPDPWYKKKIIIYPVQMDSPIKKV